MHRLYVSVPGLAMHYSTRRLGAHKNGPASSVRFEKQMDDGEQAIQGRGDSREGVQTGSRGETPQPVPNSDLGTRRVARNRNSGPSGAVHADRAVGPEEGR